MTEVQYIPQAKKPRKPQANRESRLQQSCVRWFRHQYAGHLIFSIPNAGKRGVKIAAMMKAEGLLAGVPDLCIPIPKGIYHGLYIEMKDGTNGSLSDKQKEIIPRLKAYGYDVAICRNLDEFMNTVNEYMEL